MTPYWVFALIALLILIYLLLPGGRRRSRNIPFQKLRQYFDFLLRYAMDGSFVIIGSRGFSRFVQFRKETGADGHGILTLDFPDAPWSRPYFEPVATVLRQKGISFTAVPTDSLECRQFLVVTNIRNELEAESLAKLILRELGFEENDTFDVLLQLTGTRRPGRKGNSHK